jgi:hypothetical protein
MQSRNGAGQRWLLGPYNSFFNRPLPKSVAFWLLTIMYAVSQALVCWLLLAHWAALTPTGRTSLIVVAALAPFGWVRAIQLRRLVRARGRAQAAPVSSGLTLEGEIAAYVLSALTTSYFLLYLLLRMIQHSLRGG